MSVSRIIPTLFAGTALGAAILPLPLAAHAFLDHAVPGVGAAVSSAPGELRLTFTQRVVVALSSVRIATGAGAAVPAAKPVGDSGNSAETLLVRLARPLPPGRYVVTWRVVSVDTHPTSGSYRFSIGP